MHLTYVRGSFVVVVLLAFLRYLVHVSFSYRPPLVYKESHATTDVARPALVRIGLLTVPDEPESFVTLATGFAIGHDIRDPYRHFFVTSTHNSLNRHYQLFVQEASGKPHIIDTSYLRTEFDLELLAARMPGLPRPDCVRLGSNPEPRITGQAVSLIGYSEERLLVHLTSTVKPDLLADDGHQFQLVDPCPFDPFGVYCGAPVIDHDGHVVGVYVRGRSPPCCVKIDAIHQLVNRFPIIVIPDPALTPTNKAKK